MMPQIPLKLPSCLLASSLYLFVELWNDLTRVLLRTNLLKQSFNNAITIYNIEQNNRLPVTKRKPSSQLSCVCSCFVFVLRVIKIFIRSWEMLRSGRHKGCFVHGLTVVSLCILCGIDHFFKRKPEHSASMSL